MVFQEKQSTSQNLKGLKCLLKCNIKSIDITFFQIGLGGEYDQKISKWG